MTASNKRPQIRWWVWLVVGVILVAAAASLIKWWRPIYHLVANREQVSAWVESLGGWGPIAVILLEMFQALLAFIPGQAIEAVSGYLYGPMLGTVFAMTGITIGSFIAFSLSRGFGRPLVIHLVGKNSMDRLDDLVRRGGAPFFFLIWLLPGAPDDLTCVAAGLTPMRTGQFMALMLVGRLPGVFASVMVGAYAVHITPTQWIIIVVAIAMVALMIWRWGEQIQELVLHFIERLSDRLKR